MTQELPFEALTKGYILLPKKLLEELFGTGHREMSELEATLKLLVTVNYKDSTIMQPDGGIVTCHRGESIRSWQSWADLFGWTGCRTAALKKIVDNADHNFNEFWDIYHETTRMNKINQAKAHKEWNKLTVEERQLAIEHIEEYYIHLNDTKYCLQAVNYLANKAFENEYEY